ncbi:hypothetical protein GA0115260_104519 [Streptomyces sp. MnatMP-M27]|nr:hypothetical protein GA0115260_104519 [Streptomyces sp. MnatMP-M27]
MKKPTANSSTVSAIIPMSCAVTAALLTRWVVRVEAATSSACSNTTPAVMTQAFWVVPAYWNSSGRMVEAIV